MAYKNKEDAKAYARAYYLKNKDRLIQQHREYRLLHGHPWTKEEVAEYNRAYSQKNKVTLSAKRREYNNRPEINEKLRETRRLRYANNEEHREKAKADSACRKWKFTEDFTYEMLLELRAQDCFYCGGPGGSADHLVAKSRGGLDRLDNLVPSCKPCNSSKKDSLLEDFYSRVPINAG